MAEYKGKVNPEGEFLKELRRRLGNITQEELAEKLSVSRYTISRAERGTRDIRFSLLQVATILELLEQSGMSIYDLIDSFKSSPYIPRHPDEK